MTKQIIKKTFNKTEIKYKIVKRKACTPYRTFGNNPNGLHPHHMDFQPCFWDVDFGDF